MRRQVIRAFNREPVSFPSRLSLMTGATLAPERLRVHVIRKGQAASPYHD